MEITLPTANDLPTKTVMAEMSVLAIDASGQVALEGATVPEGLLTSYLEAWRKVNPNRDLEVEADEKAPFGKLVEIWGALRKLGIKVLPTRAKVSTPNP
jgi:biopolymer transport protein ExbD